MPSETNMNETPSLESGPPLLLENLCILPPRQKNPVSREQLAKDTILLPPISLVEPIASIRAAIGEIKGYAHITNFYLVLEAIDESFIALVKSETANKIESSKEEDSTYTPNLHSKSKKGLSSSTDKGIISPYTGESACVEISPLSAVLGQHEDKSGEIVLNEFEDFSTLLQEEKLKSNMGIRIVLEKYDVGKIKAHVDRTRLLLHGNIPIAAVLPGTIDTAPVENETISAEVETIKENQADETDKDQSETVGQEFELDISNMSIPIYTDENSVNLDGSNYKDYFYLIFGDEECPTLHGGKKVDPVKSKSRLSAEKHVLIDKLCRVDCHISYGGFNPPSSFRKAIGDLLYLEVSLPDDKTVHVTAVSSGFFVNKTKGSGPRAIFNPAPEAISHYSHTLLDCLLSWSASLRSCWQTALDAGLRRSILNSKISDPLQAVCDATFQGVEAAMVGNKSLIDSVALSPSWLVPLSIIAETETPVEYSIEKSDFVCLEDTHGLDLRSGAPRDWNEELQGAREMARDTLEQRIERARAINRTLVDFGNASVSGVLAIVNGQIKPMNPHEPARSHVYLFNNIFFSRAADTGMDTFKVYHGDLAARKAANRDAKCVGTLNRMDIDGLHTLATTLIDYMGSRYVCQSIVPGILLGERTHKVLYGSVESSSPLAWDKKFHEDLESNLSDELMIATRNINVLPLYIRSETNIPDDGNMKSNEKIDFFGSIEMKGIRGSDQRAYCLDVTRLTPRDANWVERDQGGTGVYEAVLPKKIKDVPRTLKDDEWVMAVLRPEIISKYVQKKAKEKFAIKRSSEEVKEREIHREPSHGSSEEGINAKEAERKAKAKRNEEEYLAYMKQFKMNLNVFLPHLKLLDGMDMNSSAQYEMDCTLARDIAKYLWDDVLNSITNEVRENSDSIPLDGKSLTDLMHQNGVNCRYLGRLAILAIEEEQKDSVNDESYIAELKAGKPVVCSRFSMPFCWLELLETEMVARAAKHVLDNYLIEHKGMAVCQIGIVVSAFLSALVIDSEESAADTDRRISRYTSIDDLNNDFAFLGPLEHQLEVRGREEVWSDISKEVGKRFRYSLSLYNNKNEKKTKRRPFGALLRRVCQRTGVRLYAKKYVFGGKGLCSKMRSFPISASDIAGILPLVKHAAASENAVFTPCLNGADAANRSLHIHLNDAKHLLNHANHMYKTRNLQMALESSQEASMLYQQVNDSPLHEKVFECSNLVASILYQAQEVKLSISHASKALSLAIQISGFDSIDVISSRMTLSHTLLNSGRIPEAIKHMRALIYLIESLSGPNHTVLSSVYSRIAAIYEQIGVPQLALSFMQVSAIAKQSNDKVSQGQIYRRIAELSRKCGMYKQAIEAAKVAHNLFFMVLGPEHDAMKALASELQSYLAEGTREEIESQAEMQLRSQIDKANKLADEIIAQVEKEEKAKAKKKKKKKSKK